jgi:DNA polymerase III alpha subunit
MINIKCRTEFTFREVYGPIEKVLAATAGPVGICDRNGTWGHVSFAEACKKAGRKPLFGAEIAVVENMKLKEKQGVNWMSFIAVNEAGLRELYELVSLSTEPENSYYIPRIDYGVLLDISDNLVILSGSHPVWGNLPKKKHLFIELSPASQLKALEIASNRKMPVVATSDNFFPAIEDRQVYDVISGRERQSRTTPMHLLNEWEMAQLWPKAPKEAYSNQQHIADLCCAQMPKATMVHFENQPTLRSLCEKAAKDRSINLKDKTYRDRLDRELALIAEKKFEDYFYLVADIIRFAKANMLVGPARGSSCGSLVCYLLSYY